MKQNTSLEQMKQVLQSNFSLSTSDCKISSLDFVTALLFTFLGDSKTFSLASIRRSLLDQTQQTISRSTFWDRLATKKLSSQLEQILQQKLSSLVTSAFRGQGILEHLGVQSIELLDSTTNSLPQGAQDDFPGVFGHAGIKWHACVEALTGKVQYFDFSCSAKHDRNYFPPVESLKNKLILSDLGYWDYTLFSEIEDNGGNFLSRVKDSACIEIAKVTKGLNKSYEGKQLFEQDWSYYRSCVIDLECLVKVSGEVKRFRVVGFWNRDEKKYHWYVTNLKVAAEVLYAVYKLRWQIELIFKGNKQSLSLDKLPSKNPRIIKNLLMASVISHMISMTVLEQAAETIEEEEQKLALSYQRVAKIVNVLAKDLRNYFLEERGNQFQKVLFSKIKFFAPELIDPNYKKRKTTLSRLSSILQIYCTL